MRIALTVLVGLSILVVGCGSSASPDAGSAMPDAASDPDTGTAIDAASFDAGSTHDAAVVVDSGAGGHTCGTMTCTAAQVCCAATGPGGDQCSAPAACASIRCAGPEDCTGGTMCCTDGIQSTCASGGACFDRSCRTAADCAPSEACCPFGDMQNACRASC